MGELPEPWHTATERAGVRQTYRGVGEAAGISHVTARRLITEGRTSPATIRKVAAALGIDESKIHEWAGVSVSEWGPWDPPMQAQLLNPRARAALEELIRAITEGGTDEDLADSPAQKRPVVRRRPEAEELSPEATQLVEVIAKLWQPSDRPSVRGRLEAVRAIAEADALADEQERNRRWAGVLRDGAERLEQGDMTTAARKVPSSGKQLAREAEALGEGSQDDGS